jgi:hypothetical protein
MRMTITRRIPWSEVGEEEDFMWFQACSGRWKVWGYGVDVYGFDSFSLSYAEAHAVLDMFVAKPYQKLMPQTQNGLA